MKKSFIALILFTVCFFIGRFSSTQPSGLQNGKNTFSKLSEINSESFFRSKALNHKTDAPLSPSDPLEAILKNQSGHLLYQYLFEGPFQLTDGVSEAAITFIRQRLNATIPPNNSPHDKVSEQEISNRVGILKALQKRRWLKKEDPLKMKVVDLMNEVLDSKDQHWLIKRQALRSLITLNPNITETQRIERLQNLDSRVIASSAYSDHETIEMILEK